VHDHRQRQRRLERVLGDERDFRKVLIELHRTGFTSHPFQDEVDRGDDLDLAGESVERVFAGKQRIFPDAARAVHHEFAVTIFFARHVGGPGTGIEDHDTDIAHGNDGLGRPFDCGEQPVDVPGAFDQHLKLPAAIATRSQELFRLLEIVVKDLRVGEIGTDLGGDDFARR
jgi:hypothetical protein